MSPLRRRWRSTSGPRGDDAGGAPGRGGTGQSSEARLMPDESTPWATGLIVAGFVAAATAVAVVVLSLGLIRVHPMLAVGLNVVAAGGLAPTLWGWRHAPVLRWLVLGAGVGVTGAWLALVAMAL